MTFQSLDVSSAETVVKVGLTATLGILTHLHYCVYRSSTGTNLQLTMAKGDAQPV